MKTTSRYLMLPITSVLALVAATILVSCSTTSRYKADEFGPKLDGKTKTALANMDKAMADMDAQRAHAMSKSAEVLKHGKELFNDPDLGSKGLSCNSCHPGGGTTGGEAEIKKRMGHGPYRIPIPNLVGASARFPKYKIPSDQVITLAQMDNNCIRMFMGGKRLPHNSPESLYLATYVSSLSNGEEAEVSGDDSD